MEQFPLKLTIKQLSMIFHSPAKKMGKKMMQNIAVQATFLVFKANIFSLFFKPRDCKFPA
jgi:hypothetical protein